MSYSIEKTAEKAPRVNVFGHWYDVLISKRSKDDKFLEGKYIGLCQNEQKIIRLCEKYDWYETGLESKADMENTSIHELVHAFLCKGGSEYHDDEKVVKTITNLITNPMFIKAVEDMKEIINEYK